jgi:hypothetical protein
MAEIDMNIVVSMLVVVVDWRARASFVSMCVSLTTRRTFDSPSRRAEHHRRRFVFDRVKKHRRASTTHNHDVPTPLNRRQRCVDLSARCIFYVLSV